MEFIDRLINALTTHPIHTMIVHFPIALTGAAALFILIALFRKEQIFEKFAFANISLATLGTLAAGFTGMYDNQKNYLGDATNAQVKIILAIILFLLTLTITIVRWRNPNIFNQSGKALYVAGYLISFALALVLAFLGGIILYGF